MAALTCPAKKIARCALRENRAVVIIENVPHASGIGAVSFGCESRHNQREANSPRSLRTAGSETWPGSSGVERSPEKAGVGGSIPSLATIFQRTWAPTFSSPRPSPRYVTGNCSLLCCGISVARPEGAGIPGSSESAIVMPPIAQYRVLKTDITPTMLRSPHALLSTSLPSIKHSSRKRTSILEADTPLRLVGSANWRASRSVPQDPATKAFTKI